MSGGSISFSLAIYAKLWAVISPPLSIPSKKLSAIKDTIYLSSEAAVGYRPPFGDKVLMGHKPLSAIVSLCLHARGIAMTPEEKSFLLMRSRLMSRAVAEAIRENNRSGLTESLDRKSVV